MTHVGSKRAGGVAAAGGVVPTGDWSLRVTGTGPRSKAWAGRAAEGRAATGGVAGGRHRHSCTIAEARHAPIGKRGCVRGTRGRLLRAHPAERMSSAGRAG